MQKKIEEFDHILEKDLKAEMDKVIAAGTVTPTDVKNICDAICLMLKTKEYKEWLMDEEMGGYSNRGYSMDNSSYRRGRDSMTGQYISRDYGRSYEDPYNRSYARMPHGHMSFENGYSSHSINDRMIDSLEHMMDQASGDYERQRIKEAISLLSGMSR